MITAAVIAPNAVSGVLEHLERVLLGQQAGVLRFQLRDAGLELRVVFAQADDFLFLLALALLAGESPYLRLLAEKSAEVRAQRIDPHGLDWKRLRKLAIIASPTLGLTDTPHCSSAMSMRLGITVSFVWRAGSRAAAGLTPRHRTVSRAPAGPHRGSQSLPRPPPGRRR